ncbi:hypothetical protein BD410DRAFT_844807 [Rickenella mellea]|uniref:Uncharacterized protein n=1 Tax=Rickenella mellea TaxID=50990 RepID=A0A4Y7PM36_9AGAM|nr:hypothetical protein BD410DRAFT_844807 [Rickenella mellea]
MIPTSLPYSHPRTISTLSVDPSGDLVATGSTDGTVVIWSFLEEKILYTDTFYAGICSISWLISLECVTLVCGAADGAIIIISPIGPEHMVTGFTAFRAHTCAVIKLLGKRDAFVSASADELCLWSCPDGIVCEQDDSFDVTDVARGAAMADLAWDSGSKVVMFFNNNTVACYSFETHGVLWLFENPSKCPIPGTFIAETVMLCTTHDLDITLSGSDYPQIRQIPAGAAHFSPVQQSKDLFLVRNFTGDLILWDADKGNVLFFLDVRDLDTKDVYNETLAAHYNRDKHVLRIVANPRHSKKIIKWELRRHPRRTLPTPRFVTLRKVEAREAIAPKHKRALKRRTRMSTGLKASSAAADLALKCGLRRSTRLQTV